MNDLERTGTDPSCSTGSAPLFVATLRQELMAGLEGAEISVRRLAVARAAADSYLEAAIIRGADPTAARLALEHALLAERTALNSRDVLRARLSAFEFATRTSKESTDEAP